MEPRPKTVGGKYLTFLPASRDLARGHGRRAEEDDYFFLVVAFLAGAAFLAAGAFLAGAFFAMALLPPFCNTKSKEVRFYSQSLFSIAFNNYAQNRLWPAPVSGEYLMRFSSRQVNAAQ